MHQNKTKLFTIKTASVLCLIFMLTSNVSAVNMQFLKYSPVSDFTPEDFEMLQTTGKKALTDNKDGMTSEWKNPESKNSGSITPISSSTIDGMNCRKVKIINQAENKSGSAVFTFCQLPGNEWKILK
ncbi:MAG: RT0821/Lpp0805 family surface protein [Gammaproteobacteria bacterium]|nr:RT0821/Lpp0805 family surface protein [Gammaproteobacteria bacterium]